MKKLLLICLLALSGCSYRHLLPAKFEYGDCIAEKDVPAEYTFLITRSSYRSYTTCETYRNSEKWYACDIKRNGIFRDLMDEDYEKIECPKKLFIYKEDEEFFLRGKK